jgi:hypothetical protein
MLYYLLITYTIFTAYPTEDPTTFEVRTREVTDTRLFLSQEEAYTNYYREQALRPYRNDIITIQLDSNAICPLPKKK